MIPFTFITPTASADGYGSSGEALALAAVRDLGADIDVLPFDWRDDRFCEPEFSAMLKDSRTPLRDVSVLYFLPFQLARFKSVVTVSQTMWESDRMPDFWARCVEDQADGMIVPCEFCRGVFAERVDVPIEVVPYGTDPDLFAYYERPVSAATTFVMSGLLHYRKGLEFALRAFREEFAPGEDVRLVLKSRLAFLDFGGEAETLADPRVLILDHDMTREEMRNLYWSADALLAPSRGEGSGLTPRDAMATGLPVIATDWSGLAEICDESHGYPVEVECLEPVPQECSSYGAAVHRGGDLGRFARPSVAAIRSAMRSVHEDRAEARRRGRRAAEFVRNGLTWEHSARRWLAAVESLAGVRA